MAHANIICCHICYITSQDPRGTMIIWYNGESFVLTPFKTNFIDYDKFNIPMKDVKKVNTIIGIGKKFISLLIQMENMYS